MKKRFTCFAVFISLTVFSQAPNWAWAKNEATGLGFSNAADVNGNTYVVGSFQPTITFDSITLTNPGMFIVKYDASGNVIWAHDALGGTTRAYSVKIDFQGNILVVGFLIGTTTVGTTTLTSAGAEDIYLVKYAPNGSVIWARRSGGSAGDIAYSLSVDMNGDITVGGSFQSSSMIFGSSSLVCAGPPDVFVAKYDSAGNELWARGAGGMFPEEATSVVTDNAGNIFLTGYYRSASITFGAVALTNTTGNGVADIFLVKYDPNGNVIWAGSYGGSSQDTAASIALDNSGSVYLCGSFTSPVISFGTNTMVNSAINYMDLFLTKLDTNGIVLWCRSASGNGNDKATCVITDSLGFIYVGGHFSSSTLTLGFIPLMNGWTTYADMFVAKYDTNGNSLWAKSVGGNFGGNTDDVVRSIALDSTGNIYVAGYFQSITIDFDSHALSNPTSVYNPFEAKLDSNNVTTSIGSLETNSGLKVFPNPSSGSFICLSEKAGSKLMIANLFGETIYQAELAETSQQIDFSSHPNGIYFVSVISEGETLTQKIVIQK